MIVGLEAMALQVTDVRSVSRAAQQIVTPLATTNSKLATSPVPVSPDEVKFALDRVSVSIDVVERKLIECTDIISAMDDPKENGLSFTFEFPAELKARADLLTDQIENLKNVFSLVESAGPWKPYLPMVQDQKRKAIRAIANLRNAYLNIALIANQYIAPVPTVDSSVEGNPEEFASAFSASYRLPGIKQSEWQ